MAISVEEYGLVKPEAGKGNLRIKGARHLLIESKNPGRFQMHDYSLAIDSKPTIVTGPNGSGKTVYLQTVAVIQYLF